MRLTRLLMLTFLFVGLATTVTAYRQTCRTSDLVTGLQCLTGSEFDEAYLQTQCQLSCNIAELARIGAQRVSDRRLREFSKSLYNTQSATTQVLAQLCPGITREGPAVTITRENALAGLNTVSGKAFDKAYAYSLIGLFDQFKAVATIASEKACYEYLRNQAKDTAKNAQKNLDKLHRWIDTGFMTVQQEDRFCGMHEFDPRCR